MVLIKLIYMNSVLIFIIFSGMVSLIYIFSFFYDRLRVRRKSRKGNMMISA